MVCGSGGGIRTLDLQVMGLTSCQTAPPRDDIEIIINIKPFVNGAEGET